MPHQIFGPSARNETSRSTGLDLVASRSAARNKPHLYPIFGGWICCGNGWSASGNTPQVAYKRWTGGFGNQHDKPWVYYAHKPNPWPP